MGLKFSIGDRVKSAVSGRVGTITRYMGYSSSSKTNLYEVKVDERYRRNKYGVYKDKYTMREYNLSIVEQRPASDASFIYTAEDEVSQEQEVVSVLKIEEDKLVL